MFKEGDGGGGMESKSGSEEGMEIRNYYFLQNDETVLCR